MKFFSRGKLLISGEYLVLKGATALVVPLLKGQSIEITKTNQANRLGWTSLVSGKRWFRLDLDLNYDQMIDTTEVEVAENLAKILKAAQKLNPSFLSEQTGYQVTTDMDFELEWGFGSSSTLISNIAWWADVDPFALHREVSNGSGYDVIAARKENPFFYTLQQETYTATDTRFNPEFKDHIFFVYLGDKQDSGSSVKQFLESEKDYSLHIKQITALSNEMVEATSLPEFEKYMKEHNQIMSGILETPTLKETRFSDLDGEIKPLGAWGGDFAMMTWNGDPGKMKSYLELKNIEYYFTFKQLVKTK